MIKNKKISFSILATIVLFSSSCGGTVIPYSAIDNKKITPENKSKEIDYPTPVISSIDKKTGEFGEKILITGKNLYSKLESEVFFETPSGTKIPSAVSSFISNDKIEIFVPFIKEVTTTITTNINLKINGKYSVNKPEFVISRPIQTEAETKISESFKSMIALPEDAPLNVAIMQESILKIQSESKNTEEANRRISYALINSIKTEKDLDALIKANSLMGGFIMEPSKSKFATKALTEKLKCNEKKVESKTTYVFVNGINTVYGLGLITSVLLKEFEFGVNLDSSKNGGITDTKKLHEIESKIREMTFNIFQLSGFLSDLQALEKSLLKKGQTDFNLIGIYNQTQGGFSDIIESFRQKTDWYLLVNDEQKKETDKITNSITEFIKSEINSGNKIILLPHSQGNLFVNKSLQNIDNSIKNQSISQQIDLAIPVQENLNNSNPQTGAGSTLTSQNNVSNTRSNTQDIKDFISKDAMKSSLAVIGIGSPQKIFCDDINCSIGNYDKYKFSSLVKDNIYYISNEGDLVSWLGSFNDSQILQKYTGNFVIDHISKEDIDKFNAFVDDYTTNLRSSLTLNSYVGGGGNGILDATKEGAVKNSEKIEQIIENYKKDYSEDKVKKELSSQYLIHLNNWKNIIREFGTNKIALNDILVKHDFEIFVTDENAKNSNNKIKRKSLPIPIIPVNKLDDSILLDSLTNIPSMISLVYKIYSNKDYFIDFYSSFENKQIAGLFNYHPLEEGYLGKNGEEKPALNEIINKVNILKNKLTISPDVKDLLNTGKIQGTLNWGSYGDLDIHVIEPSGEDIYWDNKTSKKGSSGLLDVDQIISYGPENYYVCNTGEPMVGTYKFYVNYYNRKNNLAGVLSPKITSFSLQIRTTYSIKTFKGNVTNFKTDQDEKGTLVATVKVEKIGDKIIIREPVQVN